MIGPLVQCKECWLRLVSRRVLIITHSRALCTSKPGMSEEEMDEAAKRRQAYRQLENLDFMTATKIMLTVPPKRKKFGLDFHLWQLFVCCLPSLAVYLVAQYSRSEMRKMEAELEKKRKAEEEANAIKLAEEKLRGPEGQILEVKERLEKLENAIQVIAVEVKKESATNKRGEEATSSPSELDGNKDCKVIDAKTPRHVSSTSHSEVKQ
ncbi:hypothetical protein QQ045_001461 [Rhodiola kirilowii]